MFIQAVIFDLDGVIVDTEFLTFTAWQDHLNAKGHLLDEDDFRVLYGLDADQTVDYFCKKFDLFAERPELLIEHEKLMLSVFDEPIEPQPGIRELVVCLAEKNLLLAVASNSSTQYVETAIEKTGLKKMFSAVIGRDQVLSGKPSPDVYLAAAHKLSVAIDRCLAIEDSLVGEKSAVSSGSRCVIVTGSNPRQWEFRGAFAVYQSIEEVLTTIDQLLA